MVDELFQGWGGTSGTANAIMSSQGACALGGGGGAAAAAAAAAATTTANAAATAHNKKT